MDLVYLSAVLALAHVLISVMVGLILISKYFKAKDKTLILVGLTWIIIVESWMPSAFNLIVTSLGQPSLPYEIRALIANLFLPVGLILWTLVVTEMILVDYKKYLLIIFSIFGIIFYSILFYAVIVEVSIIIDIPNSLPLNMNYQPLWSMFQIIFSVITMATGLAFSWKSIKHENPEIKLRGKILFVAFISFLIGAILGILDLAAIGNIIMVTSSIEFYLGYILPDWIKNRWL